jgi:hypothetical protein
VSIVGLFAFRIWYFSSLFPQPVYAKSSGLSWHSLKMGVEYVLEQVLMSPSLAIFAGVAAVGVGFAVLSFFRQSSIQPYGLLSLSFLGSYVLFVCLTGGDWMEGGRFLVPILPVVAVFVSTLAHSIFKARNMARLILGALFILQVYAVITMAMNESTGMPLWKAVNQKEVFAVEYGAGDYTWFERANRVHMRDIPLIHHLDGIVQQLIEHKKGTVYMLSIQMGMVPYYIVRKHFGMIRTIDMKSLTDRILTDCDVSLDIARGQLGLEISYDHFFNSMDNIDGCPGMHEPDLIYELDRENFLDEIRASGYTVIYHQKGEITSHSNWIPGGVVGADQFIAVRDDLLDGIINKFGEVTKVNLNFHTLQKKGGE